jgi:hypothetical protein
MLGWISGVSAMDNPYTVSLSEAACQLPSFRSGLSSSPQATDRSLSDIKISASVEQEAVPFGRDRKDGDGALSRIGGRVEEASNAHRGVGGLPQR